MKPPRFLELDEVVAIHAIALERFGGGGGIRDRRALEAAVDGPRNAYYYETRDVRMLAGDYLFHITAGHCFVDGNKRAGLGAALAFLYLNGMRCTATASELEALTMQIAAGGAKQLARLFFMSHSA